MAICADCGKKMGFFENMTSVSQRCEKCYFQNNKETYEKESSDTILSQASETVAKKTDTPALVLNGPKQANSFVSSLAFFLAGIICIVAIVSALVLVADGQSTLAILTFIGGLVGSVTLALFAEISANLAKLVNNNIKEL